MIEINLHFFLFEELQEQPDGSGAVARIVIVRESKNADLAFDEGAAGLYPLE
jgi:hypothetical protein